MYAAHVAEAIDAIHSLGRGLSAFLIESMLSAGGQIVLPRGYLQHAFASVRQAGGVCIVDEVQVGFGRVGTHFWGFELQDVTPDIVVMGKPMGNGHPIGAVVTTPEIAAAFDNGMEYFNTFGGNPVSMAVGLAVLDVIEGEGLQAHAMRAGAQLLAQLRDLLPRQALIGDVRGAGLFVGIELVRDRQTLEPAAREAKVVVNALKDRGILAGTEGPLRNVVKIKPPLVFTESNADLLVETLDDVLGGMPS
jgi:4-aminobutyrate aminotransferase-like enzyme